MRRRCVFGHRALYAALLIGFVARITVFVLSRPWTPEGEALQLGGSGDILSYHYLAHDLVVHGRYGGNPEADSWNMDPVIRPLGYALFVALWYWLFTPHLWVALLAQVILATVSIWICHRVVLHAFGEPAATWAAWALALWPNHILFSTTLMTEVVYIFFVLCFLYGYAVWVAQEFRPVTASLGLGVLFALTIYVRVATVYLAPLMMFIVWLGMLSRPHREKLLAVSGFAVGTLISIVPYSLYMHSRYGTLRLTIVSEYNMLMNTIGHSIAGRTGMGDEHAQAVAGELWSELSRRLNRAGVSPTRSNPFDRAPYFRQLAWEHFLRDPGTVVAGCLNGAVRFWLWPDRVWEVARKALPENTWFQRVIVGTALVYATSFLLVLLASTLAGLRYAFFHRKPWFWITLLTTLYFTAVTNAAGNDRYRMQATVFSIPVVGIGAQRLGEWWTHRKSRKE